MSGGRSKKEDRMRKSFGLILCLILVLSPVIAFAADEGTKGASSKAYEHASDQAVFHRVSDWFATVGKSKEEKKKIKAERKAKRAAKKLKKKSKKEAHEINQNSEEKKKKMKYNKKEQMQKKAKKIKMQK